jgi:hypothetical protein
MEESLKACKLSVTAKRANRNLQFHATCEANPFP